MDKKILIGVSICAVVFLILGSLGNVVGQQSMKVDAVNDSPLFCARTQRATNQQPNIIISHYLGMEKGIFMQFPVIDKRNEFFIKIIEIINYMDDEKFERFTEKYIQKMKRDDSFRDTTVNEFFQAFDQLRTNPEKSMDTVISENNAQIGALILPTCSDFTACGNWAPGCFLQLILNKIISYLIDIFQRPTIAWLCWHSNQVPCNII